MTEHDFEVEAETVGIAEDVILGVLLDEADLVFPLTLAEQIADALREAGLLSDAATERTGDQTKEPRTAS